LLKIAKNCYIIAKILLNLPVFLNSLTAMDAHERPLFIELCGTVVSRPVFIRSQSLIAR
jgi:hypothetical protein